MFSKNFLGYIDYKFQFVLNIGVKFYIFEEFFMFQKAVFFNMLEFDFVSIVEYFLIVVLELYLFMYDVLYDESYIDVYILFIR